MSSPATPSKRNQPKQKTPASKQSAAAVADIIETTTDSPSRPKRKRKIKFPYGDDFLTSVKQEALEDDDELERAEEVVTRRAVVPPPKRSKRGATQASETEDSKEYTSVQIKEGENLDEAELEEENIDDGKPVTTTVKEAEETSSHTVGESGDAAEASSENISSDQRVKKHISRTAGSAAPKDDSDDNMCDETFGKPCHISEDPSEDMPMTSVLGLLLDGKDKMCVTRFAVPKGGEAFLFDTDIVLDLWEKDGFDWQVAAKERRSVVNGCTVVTSVDVAHHPEESKMMTRLVYSLADKRNVILVYYKEKEIEEEERTYPSDEEEVFDYKTLGFDYKEALDMLSDCDDKLSTQAPTYPKAGEIYFYDTREVGEVWKFDSYVWRNCGKRLMPSRAPQVIKSFFLIRIKGKDREGSAAFRRYTYQSIVDPHFIMVHYIGDETVFKPRPHGNAKGVTSTYTPSPSRAHSMSKSSALALKSENNPVVEDDSDVEEPPVRRSRRRPVHVTKTDYVDSNEIENYSELDGGPVASGGGGGGGGGSSGCGSSYKVISKRIKKAEPTMICDGTELLSYDFAITFLRDFNGPYCTTSAFYPKSGEVFVYNAHKVAVKWKQDGYSWADQRSTSYYPRHKPDIIRRIHCMYSSESKKGLKLFQRSTYCLADRQHVLLVHYSGDEKAAGRPELADRMVKVLDHECRQRVLDESELASVEEYVDPDEEGDYNEEDEDSNQASALSQQAQSSGVVLTQHGNYEVKSEGAVVLAQADGQQQLQPVEESHSDEYVKMRLDVLHQQKKNLELQEKKLLLEIKDLEEEKDRFFAQYGYV